MTTDRVFSDITHKMDVTVEHLGKDLAGVRTGRASLGLLDGITVEYYGAKTPISQVASLSLPDPLTIAIQPWEPSMAAVIEKAILTSDLGLNPRTDGKIVRIPIPSLTDERRKELARHVKKVAEETRVALRNGRRDGVDHIKKMEKAKEISEDDAHKGTDRVQKILDEHIARVDKLAAAKEKEIMDR
ncbi:MAG: ribosome recycling factor [Nitrospinae bacterium]|nr:ribosome recycling factor [Nitrospinota bacterium]